KIVEILNQRLSEELTAISQYMVHAEMCDNWGYSKLAEPVEKRAIEEMKHAEKLISRILFLEGRPVVNNLQKIAIGDKVETQLKNDQQAEADAVKAYNESVKTATSLGDNGTKDLLESILKDEEVHIDWLEAQLDQISQMGIQNYLESKI
ncbi:MAG TPA: bacterioferritin, partial [bacterium]